MLTVLAQSGVAHLYGFEGSLAAKIFLAGFCGMVVVALLMLRISIRHWLIAGALFATALTAAVNYTRTGYLETWMLPLQLKRAELHLVFAIALLVTCLGGLPARWMSIQNIFLLAISLYVALMTFYHEGTKDGLQSVGFALAVVPCMILAVPRVCGTLNGCLAITRVVMWVAIIWAFCCSVQFLTNPRFLVDGGGRFWGMFGNAQQAAVFCSTVAVIALGLILYDPSKRLKILWIGVLAINVLFVMWTASRTGALMTIIGATLLMMGRGGRAVLLLPAAGLMMFLLLTLANQLGIQENLDRFTSGGNSRESVLSEQFAVAMANPLFGVGLNVTFTENSYLNAFAAYGFGCFVLLVAFTVYSFFLCLYLYQHRKHLQGPELGLLYIVLSWHGMYFAAAMAEGFMVARSSTPQLMMMMFAGVAVYLRNRIQEERAHAETTVAETYGEYEDEQVEDGHPASA